MTEPATKKKRIFQIAKDLNISHTDIMDFIRREGHEAASHMSPVDHDVYDRILNEFAKERVIVDRHRKEKARRDIETARRNETAPRSRFDRILTLEEQRSLELDERDKAKRAREDVERIRLEEEAARQKEEDLKKLALIELQKQEDEVVRLRVEALKAAARENAPGAKSKKIKTSPLPTDAAEQPKSRLKRIDMRAIEAKVSQGRKKPGALRGKGKQVDIQAKSVAQTLRQTLASMSTRDKKRRPHRKDRMEVDEVVMSEGARPRIKIHEFMSVSELAAAMDLNAMDVIGACMNLGIMATINQRLELASLSIVAEDFGFEVEEDSLLNDDSILEELADQSDEGESESRPPIVTVMGHVDHGKTSLLDRIRSSNVVAGESGGITQHIGAHEVTLPNGHRITFLDTPGHAAFTSMRARGAQVTDIVVLLVAADDAVMPQTVEAINHAKAAGVRIVVAINKIDVPSADPENVKRQLSEQGILVEDWGGKYQCAEISAKTGDGIDDLLDKILVEAEILDLKAVKEGTAFGTVIEARLDKGLGPVATVLVQKGTLVQGNTFLCGSIIGRVRALQNERGTVVKRAYPSDPVLIQGFESVPQAGDRFIVFSDEREAKRIGAERARVRREMEYRQKSVRTLDEISKQIREGEVRQLSILIKADVDGSLEALRDSFSSIGSDEVAVQVIHHGVGMVSESDVLLAVASSAVIIAFRVSSSANAKVLAKNENIEIRNYEVIYDAVSEVKLALEGLLEPEKVETPLGIAEVRATFKVPRFGLIAGCYITEGKAVRAAYLRVKRDGELIHEGDLTTLKRFKDDVKEVQEGFECGIGVEGFKDFHEGDLLEVFEVKEVKRTLA